MNSLFVQHGCQTGCQKTGCQKTGCQTRLTTGLTTGCIVYTNIQPVVSCKWGIKFLTIIIYYRRRHISTSQTLPLDCLDMSICKVGQLFCSNGTVSSGCPSMKPPVTHSGVNRSQLWAVQAISLHQLVVLYRVLAQI